MSYTPMKNPTLHVRVPKWIAEAIEGLAEDQGVSSAEVCRQAIHQYLDRRSIAAPGMRPTDIND